jgi:hypothetical protein
MHKGFGRILRPAASCLCPASRALSVLRRHRRRLPPIKEMTGKLPICMRRIMSLMILSFRRQALWVLTSSLKKYL